MTDQAKPFSDEELLLVRQDLEQEGTWTDESVVRFLARIDADRERIARLQAKVCGECDGTGLACRGLPQDGPDPCPACQGRWMEAEERIAELEAELKTLGEKL